MDQRKEDLNKFKAYNEAIDNDLSLILQSLQWDRQHLLEASVMVKCRYDSNHRVPPDKVEEHEDECFLKHNGYTANDKLLPDPLDSELGTLVKLSKHDIEQIINNAAKTDHLFKRGVGCCGVEPLSLERLQTAYTADERRAIHDAVVSAVPSCHDLTDLALPSVDEKQNSKVILSRMEILAELRNMRRRRTKYRVAAKTRNYSDVLRDVIKTQMEHYNGSQNATKDKSNERGIDNQADCQNNDHRRSVDTSRDDLRGYERSETDRRRESRQIDKMDMQMEPDVSSRRHKDNREIRSDYRQYNRDRRSDIGKYDERHKERYDRDKEKRRHSERTKEIRYNDDSERDHRERHRKRRHEEDYKRHSLTIKQEPAEKEHDDGYREHNSADSSIKRHRYQDDVKQEPMDRNCEEDSNREHYSEGSSRNKHSYRDDSHENFDKHKSKHHKKKSKKEHRDDKKSHRHTKHAKTSKQHRPDRDRSSRERDEYKYSDRCNERETIIHDSEDSAYRGDTHKSKDSRRKYDKRYDRSSRGSSYDNYGTEFPVKKEPFDGYSKEVYDCNKKIKLEK